MKTLPRTLLATALLVVLWPSAGHAASTKDIVLDRVATAPAAATPGSAAPGDAMAVSVLLESPDGSLAPKPVNSLFRTGDRFRVKLLASRDARVSLYNTNPRGETNPAPIWQGEVRLGLETVTPRLALVGHSGVDQLHIVLEPRQEPTGVLAWLGQWLRSFKEGGGTSKDIRLDVENTPTASYLVHAGGQGLVATMAIVHTP